MNSWEQYVIVHDEMYVIMCKMGIYAYRKIMQSNAAFENSLSKYRIKRLSHLTITLT